jgi:hypothetical protein
MNTYGTDTGTVQYGIAPSSVADLDPDGTLTVFRIWIH